MSFHQPFRAVPIKLGKRYRRKAQSARQLQVAKFLAGAAGLGALAGAASLALTPAGIDTIGSEVRSRAVSLGFLRARAPMEGDHWANCDAARAAGTVPIYVGEPGYREGMDGDSDGIACEPYR